MARYVKEHGPAEIIIKKIAYLYISRYITKYRQIYDLYYTEKNRNSSFGGKVQDCKDASKYHFATSRQEIKIAFFVEF